MGAERGVGGDEIERGRWGEGEVRERRSGCKERWRWGRDREREVWRDKERREGEGGIEREGKVRER